MESRQSVVLECLKELSSSGWLWQDGMLYDPTDRDLLSSPINKAVMRLNSKLIAALAASSILIALILWPAPEEKIILPEELADGSHRFTLVGSGNDLERFTEDDRVWILRFPPQANVRVPDLHRTDEQKERNPNWKNNYELSFDLVIKEAVDADPVRVFLTARSQVYRVSPLSNVVLDQGWEALVERVATYSCSKDFELYTGIWQLRHQTPEETARLRAEVLATGVQEHRIGFLGECPNSDASNFVAIYAPDGKAIGHGRCTHGAKPTCSISVWVSQNTDVMLKFERRLLSEVHLLYRELQRVLDRATEAGLSRNL